MKKRLFRIAFMDKQGRRDEVEIMAIDVARAVELLARTYPNVYPISMVSQPHVREVTV